MNFKIGGFYETKDNGWFFVNKMRGEEISGRFIYIDKGGYDEDITDIKKSDLEPQLLDGKCWVGKYHRQKGLYEVWDGGNKSTIRRLQ